MSHNPEFSFLKLPVSKDDIERMRQAVQLLKQVNGFLIGDDFETIVQRLSQRLYNFESQDENCVLFDNTPVSVGAESLDDIYKTILDVTR